MLIARLYFMKPIAKENSIKLFPFLFMGIVRLQLLILQWTKIIIVSYLSEEVSMLKIFIKIRKIFWIKPKWRILRIYTKTISRKKIELLRKSITEELLICEDDDYANFLKGELHFINLLLKE